MIDSQCTVKLVETVIEIALWVGEHRFPSEDNVRGLSCVDNAGGISLWIKDRAVEFEEEHKDTDWAHRGDFYEAIEDWIAAYIAKLRLA